MDAHQIQRHHAAGIIWKLFLPGKRSRSAMIIHHSTSCWVLRVVEEEIADGGTPQDEIRPAKEVKPRLYVMANPEIVNTSKETVIGVEGCLSIPGLVGDVERFSMVQVTGLNRRGQPMKVKAEGWLARIFQHEIDHINGVVFPDRATRVWKPEPEGAENLA